MPRLFISYRRDDSQYVTDRLFDQMVVHFGADSVFLDIDKIPPGVDFRRFIQDEVAKADVVLVVIGREWERIIQERADQPNDFVRLEVEAAFEQNKLVIPVLVKNASMPRERNLPTSIQRLCYLNAPQVRRTSFNNDCVHLVKGIDSALAYLDHSTVTVPKSATPTAPDTLDIARSFSGNHNADWTPVFKTFTVKGIDFEMCLVPPGSFMMGSDDGFDDEKPAHKQTLHKPYWIGVHPVTNAQWRLAVEGSGSSVPKPGKAEWYDDDSMRDHPVVKVSWNDCQKFLAWLGDDWRLPTEPEWEYAARGVDNLVYPFGNKFQPDLIVYYENSNGSTAAVGGRPGGASWVGAQDMSGNVYDWLRSEYREYPYKADDGRENMRSNARRVLRGGGWIDNHYAARAASRYDDLPVGRANYDGLRVVCPPSLLRH